MKNIIFDLGGVVVEWNAKRVIETFKGNPILVNFVRENRLFLNDWRDYDRGDVTRQELINKVAILSGCPPEDCNEFVEHVKHSLVSIPETETLIKELSARGFKLYCLSNMSVDFYDYLKTREVFKYFDGQIITIPNSRKWIMTCNRSRNIFPAVGTTAIFFPSRQPAS